MPKPRRCAIPSTTSTISTCRTLPRCGGAAASSPPGCSICTAAALIEDPHLSQVRRAGVRFRRRPLDDQGGDRRGRAGAMCCRRRSIERFSSRGEADFADKLLSAMRYEFGGHIEKPAGSIADREDQRSHEPRMHDKARRTRNGGAKRHDQAKSSINSRSTRSARCRSTRSSRRSPAIPARRWRWRRWSTRCGTGSCASIRRTRSGPIATASCCPTATPRCCCGRCCYLTRHAGRERATTSAWASRRSRSTTSVISASSTARRRAIRNITGCRASRRRPARWGRASPPASAWRSRASGWPAATTGPASSCSTTTSTPCAATAA